MHAGNLVFAQLMEHLPLHTFRRCVARFDGEHKVQRFSCLDQFFVMAFAQLTYRESLRDIEACLRAQQSKLYHLGVRGGVSRNTLANANAVRDWRIYEDFGQRLISLARRLYADEKLEVKFKDSVYALDATTIDLCLSLFPWAPFQQSKAAVKLHTLLDLRGNIPSFLYISDSKFYDVKVLDLITPEAGAFYVMDLGYHDFKRLHRLQRCGAFFVTRARTNTRLRRVLSTPTDQASGVLCDQYVLPARARSAVRYPERLRRIRFKDPGTAKTLVFLTNHFELPALTICALYRMRWRVELFFKWIKQHLRIKAFFGHSENAVKSQIWIAVSTYLLVAIVRKRLQCERSMHEILQILSLALFEKTPLPELLSRSTPPSDYPDPSNQLNLLD